MGAGVIPVATVLFRADKFALLRDCRNPAHADPQMPFLASTQVRFQKAPGFAEEGREHCDVIAYAATTVSPAISAMPLSASIHPSMQNIFLENMLEGGD